MTLHAFDRGRFREAAPLPASPGGMLSVETPYHDGDTTVDDDDSERQDAWRILGRAMRLRCPVCDQGELFHGLHIARRCARCGFLFEREPGYWSNAATLNFMTTGSAATMAIAPMAMLSRWSLPVLLGAALLVAVGLALLCFRHIKAVWLAADLLIRPPTTIERLSGYLHTVREPAALVSEKFRE